MILSARAPKQAVTAESIAACPLPENSRGSLATTEKMMTVMAQPIAVIPIAAAILFVRHLPVTTMVYAKAVKTATTVATIVLDVQAVNRPSGTVAVMGSSNRLKATELSATATTNGLF